MQILLSLLAARLPVSLFEFEVDSVFAVVSKIPFPLLVLPELLEILELLELLVPVLVKFCAEFVVAKFVVGFVVVVVFVVVSKIPLALLLLFLCMDGLSVKLFVLLVFVLFVLFVLLVLLVAGMFTFAEVLSAD